MVRLGLTGGIASGKSFVADALAELGAVVIDADVLAREVVERGTDGLAAVVDRFGPGVLRADGSLDRAGLGSIVFGDDAARADLNAIIHPRVRARAAELEAQAPPGSVVVHVIPLLVETGQADSFQGVLVVDVPPALQVERVAERDGLNADQAQARLRAQATREQRLAAADWVVDNSGTREITLRQVKELWEGPIAALRPLRDNAERSVASKGSRCDRGEADARTTWRKQ